jgi:hypothetical protein
MNTEWDSTLSIAKAQKGVLWCIFAYLVWLVLSLTMTGSEAIVEVLQVAYLIMAILCIYFIWQLAAALRCGPPILWAVGMLIPLLGFILLAVINQKATTRLREAGLQVGIMGVDLNNISQH